MSILPMSVLNKKPQPVNLLPKDEEEKTLANRIIQWLLTTFRFLVITVELLVIVGFLSRFFLDSQNSDLSDEINQKKALIESYLPFEKEFKLAQERISIIKSHTQKPFFSEILNKVTSYTTSNLQLFSLQVKKETIEIFIQGSSEQAIDIFVRKIKDDPSFSDIHITTIESVTGTNQVKATIVGSIKPL